MGRVERITREVRNHDRNLFCKENVEGMLCIHRKTTAYDAYHFDGVHLVHARPSSELVIPLSDNWSIRGKPVEWGIEPILAKLRSIDLASRPEMFGDLNREYEKGFESERRDLRNKTEAFASEFHSQFKKTFSDVRVANMDKKQDSRRKENGSS